MTMDERVEAAARAYDHEAFNSFYGDVDSYASRRAFARYHAGKMIPAAFPELHGDQPKGWIAPWELPYEAELATVTAYALWTQTEIGEIAKAVGHIETTDELKWQDRGWRQGFGTTSGEQIRVVWQAARDAYLSKGNGG